MVRFSYCYTFRRLKVPLGHFQLRRQWDRIQSECSGPRGLSLHREGAVSKPAIDPVHHCPRLISQSPKMREGPPIPLEIQNQQVVRRRNSSPLCLFPPVRDGSPDSAIWSHTSSKATVFNGWSRIEFPNWGPWTKGSRGLGVRKTFLSVHFQGETS